MCVCVCVLILHCPLWKIRVALLSYGTAAARAALPFPTSVCGVLAGVQTMVWLPALGSFNARTDADAYDCTSNPRRYCAFVCNGTLYQLNYSNPTSCYGDISRASFLVAQQETQQESEACLCPSLCPHQSTCVSGKYISMPHPPPPPPPPPTPAHHHHHHPTTYLVLLTGHWV